MPSEQNILPSEAILERYGTRLDGKTILITGVSKGSIAGELALQLSNVSPALLILSARSESRVEPIVEKIQARNPNVATRFLKMDLGSLKDIHRAVNSLDDIAKIDHIAAVAGIMMPPYGTTVDGVESQFGVNYLANFLLVKLLLPKVQAAGPSSSIIVVASSAVRSGIINFGDIGYSDGKTYDALAAYGQSNVARVMFAKRLAEKLNAEKIRVYSIDPGALHDVDGKEYQLPPWTSTSEGAATIITGMIDPTIETSTGSFLHNNAVADEELHSHVIDQSNWEKLWNLSENLIGEKFIQH
ncbi:hypothetical protein PLIIFM63780_002248 [Purpureocillium lilacinum]|nr:hypothetical protein PLIIFM63780_002248 [Purpureocillium lilacinum]